MFTASSRFVTPNGSSYIQRICKHFAHKIDVKYDEHRGECVLPSGKAAMEADDQGLSFFVTAEDEEGLTRVKAVIEDHLIRFAFRENLEKLDWTDATA